MEFFISCNPPTATAQEKKVAVRNGKPIFYEPAKLKKAKRQLIGWLAPNAPESPMAGAVYLEVHWYFQCTKAHPDGSWRTTKPDTDNLEKMLKDCMSQVGFWKDDAQVVYEKVEKKWSSMPGIKIRAEMVRNGVDDIE